MSLACSSNWERERGAAGAGAGTESDSRTSNRFFRAANRDVRPSIWVLSWSISTDSSVFLVLR